jgi:serine acetyltransferase
VPPAAWIANTLVNRIPLVSLRMRCYALMGISFEDQRTGTIMLATEIRAPGQLHIGRNSAIGRHCTIDARGGITIGRDVNISSDARLQSCWAA